MKIEEKHAAKSQSNTYIDKKIEEAVRDTDERHRQRETTYQLHIS
jgi:hypothetical protein